MINDRACRTDTLQVSNYEMLSEMQWAGLLEKYIAWLATQYAGPCFNLIAHHFDLSGYRTQLRDQVRAGKLAESVASHSLFIASLLRARKMSQVIIDNNIGSAKIRHLHERLNSGKSTCGSQPSDVDEIELKSTLIRKHTEKWREMSSQMA